MQEVNVRIEDSAEVNSTWPGFIELESGSLDVRNTMSPERLEITEQLALEGIKEQRATFARMYMRAFRRQFDDI